MLTKTLRDPRRNFEELSRSRASTAEMSRRMQRPPGAPLDVLRPRGF
jgi:hypothetical protein